MAAKGKRTFWVAPAITPLHTQRIEQLNKNGFDVVILKGFQEILVATAAGRPSCLLVDTPEGDPDSTLKLMNDLTGLAELNGVRFILSSVTPSTDAMALAVAENFRDILPLKLPDEMWLQRILYTTAIKATPAFPAPLCEISMNQFAVVRVPARVVWINETHIRIECRGSMQAGSTLQMTGPISQAFGVGHIGLTVESVRKNQLRFRFSQALVCRWRVPGANTASVSTMIRTLLTSAQNESKLRAYVVVSSAAIRKTLTTELNPGVFELKIGLQRHTIPSEIEYFSPDVIFLDSPIVKAMSGPELDAILSTIPGDVPIVVFGSDVEKVKLTAATRNRTVFYEPSPNPAHLAEAGKRYRVVAHAHGGDSATPMAQIKAEDAWSKIEVHVPARLVSLNASVGEIALPFSIGVFTLAKLEAPLLRKALGRDPFIKITDSTERASDFNITQFNQHCHFYLADTTQSEQITLAGVLVNMLAEYYKKYFSSTVPPPLPATRSLAPLQVAPIQLAIVPPEVVASKTPVLKTAPAQAKPIVEFKENIDIDYGAAISSSLVNAQTVIVGAVKKSIDMTVLKSVATLLILGGVAAYIISHTDDSGFREEYKAESQIFKNIAAPGAVKKSP
jgi:hypothetical protein